MRRLGGIGDDVGPKHLTPASSLCTQLCRPMGLARQSMSLLSLPEQLTSSSQIAPVPRPNCCKPVASSNTIINRTIMFLRILTYIIVSELSADHHSIKLIPSIITHCPPSSINAYFYTSFKITPSPLQSDITTGTSCSYGKYSVSILILISCIYHSLRMCGCVLMNISN